MQDTYRTSWRAKRMSAAQLIESHKLWGPQLQRWVAQAQQNAEYQRQLEEERKLNALVEKLEPVNNWFGPCIVAPNGDIYPVTGSHEGTAGEVLPKVYPDEYARQRAEKGYVDALETLCCKFGWARVSWYGEITKAYWNEKPELTERQKSALWAMADEKATRVKMRGAWNGFTEHLRRSIDVCDRVAALA